MSPTVLRALVAVAFVACVGAAFFAGRADMPGASGHGVDVRATAGVVTAIRDVARLEATTFHIEKVVEATDAQSRLWGLVEAKDVLLLVAVGDVVAGVDLGKVLDQDVQVDPEAHAVHVRLPAPEVISSTLDERETHVYARSTDVLAERNERLEGEARRQAEEQMRKAAVDRGILERARVSAERTLRALLRSLGYAEVDVTWADR
ncbi:MAG TPA: DUF4230 domain-containing protein [Polyangiaceae bacterium]